MSETKCKCCGKSVQLSRDGWLLDTIIKGKREVRYVEWFHIVGHYGQNGKPCSGSGDVAR